MAVSKKHPRSIPLPRSNYKLTLVNRTKARGDRTTMTAASTQLFIVQFSILWERSGKGLN
uniref:Uncharacterized protein n=1 Tax=Anopheles albimanus TaxID=7167 RepID=A0A182FZE2_ANOAL